MTKYYSLIYVNIDSPSESYLIKIVKIRNNGDIYDYLTNKYLKYKKTDKEYGLDSLFFRIDSIIDKMEQPESDSEFSLDYSVIYEIIKDDCSSDMFDRVVISNISNKFITTVN